MSHYKTIQALGTPIVLHSGITKMLGSITASCLLSHIMYWADKTDNPLGFYRTLDELYAETSLTEGELRAARKKLVSLGIITETYKRLEHRLYFKFNADKFDELFSIHLATCKNHISPSVNLTGDEIEKAISPNDKFTDGSVMNLQVGSGKNNKSLYTKITTKNTTESECTPAQTSGLVKSSNDKQASDSKQSKLIKPDDISEQVWQDLLKFRKQKTRSDMTVTAWNRNFKQLLIANQATGHSLDDLIAFWIAQGWQGFESEWYLNRQGQAAQQTIGANKPATNSFSAYGLNYLALGTMTAKETFEAVMAKMGRMHTFEEAYHLLKDELSGAVA